MGGNGEKAGGEIVIARGAILVIYKVLNSQRSEFVILSDSSTAVTIREIIQELIFKYPVLSQISFRDIFPRPLQCLGS